jgi:CPA2 family monovalent cation:H+ antiporter-2
MHGLTFLQDLAVVMIVAGLVTILFHRFKQPVVLGYIVAGVIIGPHTPPFPLIHDEATIHTLAELGIIFLMFSLGLEFNLRKLKQVGVTALLAALLEIVLMVGAGYELGRMFGWSSMDSLFLGSMLAISSTTIIIKALGELGLAKERFAGLIFGILIIEDILAIVMIALLSGIAMTGTLSVAGVGLTIGKLAIFLTTALVLGLIGVPRLLGFVGRFKSNEMLLVTVLGLCFGFSLLAVKLGYSVALGAFVIGAVISEARELGRIEHLTEPLRDMFSAVFFVAIGMLIDPKMLLSYAWPIAAITVVVIVGKVLTCSFGTFIAGNDTRTSLKVGMGLAQIGEFSFIIAALGLSLKVTSDFLYPIAVAVSALTTLFTPYLIKSADGLVGWFDRTAPRPLLGYLEVYTRWVGQLGSQRKTSFPAQLIRKWTLQMLLNVLLIAAVFLCAAFLGRRSSAWLPNFLARPEIYRTALWLAAVVLALPLFIATFRKLQALGLLVAEVKITPEAAGERTAALRSVVSHAIPFAGLAGLTIFGLTLSSTLLPPFRILIVLLMVVALLTWLLWRSSIRIYSKAQIALQETLSQPPPSPVEKPAAIPALLREADLEALTIGEHSVAARKLIRELALRTRTGASVVGIERAGKAIINPGPDEELLPGDQILIIGSAEQLASARALMA